MSWLSEILAGRSPRPLSNVGPMFGLGPPLPSAPSTSAVVAPQGIAQQQAAVSPRTTTAPPVPIDPGSGYGPGYDPADAYTPSPSVSGSAGPISSGGMNPFSVSAGPRPEPTERPLPAVIPENDFVRTSANALLSRPGNFMDDWLVQGYMNAPNVAQLTMDTIGEQLNMNADRVGTNNRFQYLVDAMKQIAGGGGQGMTGFQDQNSRQGGSLAGSGGTAQYNSGVQAGGIPQSQIDRAVAGVAGRPYQAEQQSGSGASAPAQGQWVTPPGGGDPKFVVNGQGGWGNHTGGVKQGAGSAGSVASGRAPPAMGVAASPEANAELRQQFNDHGARLGAIAANDFSRSAGAANRRLDLNMQQGRAGIGTSMAQLLAQLDADRGVRSVAGQRMLSSLAPMIG